MLIAGVSTSVSLTHMFVSLVNIRGQKPTNWAIFVQRVAKKAQILRPRPHNFQYMATTMVARMAIMVPIAMSLRPRSAITSVRSGT